MSKSGLLKEFKEFAMKGNVVDLAVAVVIGSAFGKIVTSMVDNIIMPVLSIFTGRINFSDLKLVLTPASDSVKEVAFRYGAFLQSIVDFLIIAFCIFLIIKLLNSFKKKEQAATTEKPSAPMETPKEVELLSEIRDLLKKQNAQ